MKKALSLALALMMMLSMCVVSVTAAADGTADHPYYVANPMNAPKTVTIPAHSTVYYQYKAAVFNGWEVGGYGLSAITVDGAVFDTPDMWGEIYAPLNFKFMSPGVVGYVNNTDEAVEVMINHNEPVGSTSNPDVLVEGENTFTIPANNPSYVADYLPKTSGTYTFACEQSEDFIITIDTDGDFENEVYETLNGSLTLELESYVPVRVSISPVGNTSNVTLILTAPKAGTPENPIWLGTDELLNTYDVAAGDPMYFSLDGSFTGNTLTVTSSNGDVLVSVDGEEFATDGGSVSIPLETEDWMMELIVSADAATTISFTMGYAAGSAENPIALNDGRNPISIPESYCYYYTYTAQAEGLLVLTPGDASAFDLLDIFFEDAKGNIQYAYLAEGASSAMIPVPAGQTVVISACGVMDEDTFLNSAVNTTLKVEVKDLLLFNTFEGVDGNGDLEGWATDSHLELEEAGEESNVANGFYSAEFNANLDWANLYRNINVEPNTNYVVSFKAKALLEKGLWIKFCKTDWNGDVAAAEVNLTTEWADYKVVLNSGDYTSLVLLIQYSGLAADGQSIWLDDIVITTYTEDDEPNYGDANSDGKINNKDLGLMQQYLNEWAVTIDLKAADVNGDDKVNNKDLGMLQQILNN